MAWRLVYTRQAQQDARKIDAGLRRKVEKLLRILERDPFASPPRPLKNYWVICPGPIPDGSRSSTGWSTRSWRASTSLKSSACGRIMNSAAHTSEHLDRAIAAFVKVGEEFGVVENSRGNRE